MRLLQSAGWLFLGFSVQRRFQWMSTLRGQDFLDTAMYHQPLRVNHKNRSDIDESTHNYPLNSSVTFLFVIGLEKTGHHFLETVAQNSSMKSRLFQQLAPDEHNQLHRHLFCDQTGDGLWNAHCLGQDVNTTFARDNIIDLLQRFHTRLQSKSPSHVIFPINTLKENGEEGYGMVSYPNFWGSCRFLAYPSLQLWYEACDMANVDCKQVYLYRNPRAIVQSSVANAHTSTALHAIHMYTSMLHMVANHLELYSGRTIGCFGFFENTTSSWWEPVRILWDLGYPSAYENLMKKLYHPPTGKNESLISRDLDIYLGPLLKLHNRVVQICQRSLRDRN